MADSDTIQTELNIIKQCLDKFEKESVCRFTSDAAADSTARTITSLFGLYNELIDSSVFFRRKLMEDVLCGNRITAVASILFTFFTLHLHRNQQEFERRYPCISQMIFMVSNTDTS